MAGIESAEWYQTHQKHGFHVVETRGRPTNRNSRLNRFRFQVFITIGNLHFWTPIMADYIALHEETGQADYLLCECSKEPR